VLAGSCERQQTQEKAMMRPFTLFHALIILASFATETFAASVERGRNLARTYCAGCHSTDKVTNSPLAIAPPFRTLHKKYAVETLEEPLAEGIVTGHPTMPEFSFASDQIGDFIAFLKSLE
jgi:mono/diheme cytochrome c family protein